MVESDRAIAAGLRGSARELGAEGLEVVNAEALSWLARGNERFDVVFVDPPFASDLAQAALAVLPPRLDPGARVYVESPASLDLPASWRAVREDRAGAVRYALYELGSP
jgi:16S rRNA (guanine966-N2)-methyltransferase